MVRSEGISAPPGAGKSDGEVASVPDVCIGEPVVASAFTSHLRQDLVDVDLVTDGRSQPESGGRALGGAYLRVLDIRALSELDEAPVGADVGRRLLPRGGPALRRSRPHTGGCEGAPGRR